MDEKQDRVFKIPEFEYFEMGGKYSGCKRGKNSDDFSFRITPEEKLTVQIWYDIKCFELSETAAEQEFPLDRDGCRAAVDWIEEQFQIWHKDHKLKSSDLGYFAERPETPDWLITNYDDE